MNRICVLALIGALAAGCSSAAATQQADSMPTGSSTLSACATLSGLQAAALEGVQMPEAVAYEMDEEFSSCVAAQDGAWGLAVAFAEPGEWGTSLRFAAVFCDHSGTCVRRDGFEMTKITDDWGTGYISLATAADLTGDGHSDFLLRQAINEEGSHPSTTHLLTAASGSVEPVVWSHEWAPVERIVAIEDADADGIADFSFYAVHLWFTGGMDGEFFGGIPVLAHGTGEGVYSRDDDVARQWATRVCEERLGDDTLGPPDWHTRVADYVHCARVTGGDPSEAFQVVVDTCTAEAVAQEYPPDLCLDHQNWSHIFADPLPIGAPAEMPPFGQ